jgi:hypothetical protein
MKPTIQITHRHGRNDSFVSRRQGSPAPRTDYNFQPTTRDFSGRGGGEGAPSFREISASYFEREARSHFRAEALVFGVIILTGAVPVIEAARGLAELVSGIL